LGQKQQSGQKGERLASEYLKKQNYTIIATNWRCPRGEIDIIAGRNEGIIFIEVRTRHAETTEASFESVNRAKQRKLIASAQLYLQAHNLENHTWRIDVIAIALPRSGDPLIDHLENALDW